MIDISGELEKNTREFKAVRNAKEVTNVQQFVQYIATYGIEFLPEGLANDPELIEAFEHVQRATALLSKSDATGRLIRSRPQVEKMLDLNRENRIMLQQVRDVFR